MNQAVASILESIRKPDLEEAKAKLSVVMTQAKTDREKGSVMAAAAAVAACMRARHSRGGLTSA